MLLRPLARARINCRGLMRGRGLLGRLRPWLAYLLQGIRPLLLRRRGIVRLLTEILPRRLGGLLGLPTWPIELPTRRGARIAELLKADIAL